MFPECATKIASVREFPENDVKETLISSKYALRWRVQGFMASLTAEALKEDLGDSAEARLVSRALGHYGMKEPAAAHEQLAWDSPAIKTMMQARVKRAAVRLARDYVSVSHLEFEISPQILWWR